MRSRSIGDWLHLIATEAQRRRRHVAIAARGLSSGDLSVPMPASVRPPSHGVRGYVGPWVEDAFFRWWWRNAERLAAAGVTRRYVPVFWTDYYARHGRFNPHPELQRLLDERLDPDGRYLAVVEHNNGIRERLPGDVLVFAAGGVGDVPIPLLNRRPRARPRERDILCSFMGRWQGWQNRTGVRERLVEAIEGEPGFHLGWGTYGEFVDATRRSVFALCPRGYGRTSFRLVETMALGAVPVYVWDDLEWLPWPDELDWRELCVSVHVDDVGKIPELLRSIDPQQAEAMRAQIAELIDSHFSLAGTCERIGERLQQEAAGTWSPPEKAEAPPARR